MYASGGLLAGSSAGAAMMSRCMILGGASNEALGYGIVDDPDVPGLAVPGAGAYARSMASNYNHVPRPPAVAVRDGAWRTLIRRETIDDLLALDVG